MNEKAEIMDENAINRAIVRITYEILEKNHGAENLCIIGIKRRGAALSKTIAAKIREIEGVTVPTAFIDITPFRDDKEPARGFLWANGGKDAVCGPREKDGSALVDETPPFQIPFDISGKKVVLVDDVICTGRSARAAIDGVMLHGRPELLQLAVLIDRGHRELPICADFVGKNVPTAGSETVEVMVTEYDGVNRVAIFEK